MNIKWYDKDTIFQEFKNWYIDHYYNNNIEEISMEEINHFFASKYFDVKNDIENESATWSIITNLKDMLLSYLKDIKGGDVK